jgi:hypothetical protein
MATTLKFLILGDDRASGAFDKFARSVDKANGAVDRNSKAITAQGKAANAAQGGILALTGTISGFGDASTIGSKKATMFAKGLAAVNLATGVLEPALAGVVVAAGALSGALAAGGAGLGAYGLVLKNVGTQLQKLKQLQTAAATGNKTAQKALQAFVKTLSPALRQFAGQLERTKQQYADWGKSLESPVLKPLTRALKLVQPALGALSPLVLAAASAVKVLVGELGAKIAAGGLQHVVAVLLPHVRPAILALAHSLGNVTAGIWGIVKAFLPMSNTMVGGVERLTAKFKEWGNSLPAHSGFQSLMNMFRQETPLAVQVLKNLAEIIKNVAAAMVGLATPANSKALLQILMPLTSLMRVLSQNQALVRAIFYFVLLRKAFQQLLPLLLGTRGAFLGLAAAMLADEAALKGLTGKTAASSAKWLTYGKTILFLTTSLAGGIVSMAGAAAAGAALALVLTSKVKPATQLYIDELRKQSDAVGFNIAGYSKFGAALANHVQQMKSSNAVERVAQNSAIAAQRTQIAQREAIDATSAAYKQNAAETSRLTQFLNGLQNAYGLTRDQAVRLADGAGVQASQVAKGGKSMAAAQKKANDYATAINYATGKTNAQTIATNGLFDSLDKLNKKLTGGKTSELDWRDAIAQATRTLHDNSGAMGVNTQKGRDDRRAILQATSAALTFATQQDRTRAGIKRASGTISDQISWLQKYGGKSSFVRGLIEQLRQKLADLRAELHRLNQVPNIKLAIQVLGIGKWSAKAQGHALAQLGHAAGWRVPGSGNRDTVPAMLTPGEAVVPKRLVPAVAPFLGANRVPGFAGGGIVGSYADGPGGLKTWTTHNWNATIRQIITSIASNMAREFAQAMTSGAPGALGGPSSASARQAIAYARSRMGAYGWGSGQMSALIPLWMGESGWNRLARNQSSGAYGIPQALPASKMGALANPPVSSAAAQINWGLGYIRSRYGSPGGAYSAWLSRSPHWYGHGTAGAAPGWAWVGERGPELVRMRGGETVLPHAASRMVAGYAKGTRDTVAEQVHKALRVIRRRPHLPELIARLQKRLGKLTGRIVDERHLIGHLHGAARRRVERELHRDEHHRRVMRRRLSDATHDRGIVQHAGHSLAARDRRLVDAIAAAHRRHMPRVARRLAHQLGDDKDTLHRLNRWLTQRTRRLAAAARREAAQKAAAAKREAAAKVVRANNKVIRAYISLEGGAWSQAAKVAAEQALGMTGVGRWTGPISFDRGGWLMPGATLAINNTRRPERVGAPAGHVTYNINVSVPPNANQATIGRQIVTAIKEFERSSGRGWRK